MAATSMNNVANSPLSNALAEIWYLLKLLTTGGASQSYSGTLTDGSGTITAGGTSQVVFASNTSRKYLIVQNISDETQYVNFGASAAVDTNSIKLEAGGGLEFSGSFVPSDSINIIGATTGKGFVAKQG